MRKILTLILIVCSVSLHAGSIDRIIFFGDSLTDNGNLYYAFKKYIPKSPPYYQGRFSNGPTWAEDLGDYYRAAKGIDYSIYAIGGTTVVLRNPVLGNIFYTLDEEITNYMNANLFSDKSNELFFIWMGANDYMDELQQDVNGLTNDVVSWLTYEVKRLITTPWQSRGAKNIVILNVPDLSRIPYALQADDKLRARWAELSRVHHEKMLARIKELQQQYPDVRIIYVDVLHMFNDILDNPGKYNQRYNKQLHNTLEACWLGGKTFANNLQVKNLVSRSVGETYRIEKMQESGFVPCDNPDEHVYWDSIHPSKTTHQLLADTIREQLSQAGIIG